MRTHSFRIRLTHHIGCKRRIFDPNYLESLHRPNLEVVAQGIKTFDETGIISDDGTKTEFDIIVLATGFQVQQFLTPMEVHGKGGVSLSQQWREKRGAQAYMGSYVNNFPNFGILYASFISIYLSLLTVIDLALTPSLHITLSCSQPRHRLHLWLGPSSLLSSINVRLSWRSRALLKISGSTVFTVSLQGPFSRQVARIGISMTMGGILLAGLDMRAPSGRRHLYEDRKIL